MVKNHLSIQLYWEELKVFDLSVIQINIIDVNDKKHAISVNVNPELSLMEVVKNAGFSMGNCGGMALCASCHCYVFVDDNWTVNKKTESEEDMLDQLHNSDIEKSRLICQIPVSEELNGITLQMIKN